MNSDSNGNSNGNSIANSEVKVPPVKKFRKILIANRGEVAIRLIRGVREMGMKSVAVFSDADRDSLHVFLADEAYNIGPAPSRDSYLNIEKILAAAKQAQVEAIHPGYGFLSESAQFAEAVEKAGFVFIGSTVANLALAANKTKLTEALKKVGLQSLDAEQMALIRTPKHIEIQVLGDSFGNVVHLFERECSIQRKNRKILEEAPSPSLSEKLRQELCNLVVQAAKSIGLLGSGTFEFVLDVDNQKFYFTKLNARLQLSHPITELTTGVDIVKEQINIAQGLKLDFAQKDIIQKSHAIEVRVYAEDPSNYTPCPGVIRACRHPQGPFLRVDSYAYPGYEIPIFYSPMFAKVITWGEQRSDAINRMQRALAEFILTGVKTNIVLHRSILEHPRFLDGSYSLQFLEKDFILTQPEIFRHVDDHVFLIAAAITAYQERKSKQMKDSPSLWHQTARRQSLRQNT